MGTIWIFIWIFGAMIAHAFWEAYGEGRKAWDKGKLGWKLKIGNFTLPAYHFYLFVVMYPLLLTLPLIIGGWDIEIFGVIISAYSLGLIIQDFGWYVVNPKVKLKEFYSPFSDYYPWIKIGKQKIVPIGYVVGIFVSLLSWFFIWG